MIKKNLWKLLIALLMVMPLLQCGRKAPGIEKTFENGVEIVINHLEPYKLPGVPSEPSLEEIFSIDLEKEEIAKTGLTNIESFAVAPNGDIYLSMRESPGDFIYRFDASGKFIGSFGRKGQGPGEFEAGGNILIDDENRIIAKDMTLEKFYIFNFEGALLKEVRLEKNIEPLEYLGNREYLTSWYERDPVNPLFREHYCVSNERLDANKEFYAFEFGDDFRASTFRPSLTRTRALAASDRFIFVADSRKGYEIGVFDFSGNLVRKIRKEFKPVAIPAAYKSGLEKSLKRNTIGQSLLAKIDWPADLPPFRYLFTDATGRLYVMTHEREGDRGYWHDVFTNEGAFIGRFKLDNVKVRYFEGRRISDNPTDVLIKNDRLYCVRENDNGFMALTVYKMIWSLGT